MRTIRVLDAAQAAPQLQDVAGAVERKGIDMTKSLKMAGYAAMLMAMQATASAASAAAEPAGSVREHVITRLGVNVSAVTYWVTGPEGWRVVTTVDTAANEHSNRDAHAIVRFSHRCCRDSRNSSRSRSPLARLRQCCASGVSPTGSR